jgi:ribosomal-protein-alanine acetyltransferase
VFGVATVGGSPVGHAVLQAAGDEAYLGNIVIHPGFRGMGLGKSLLEWVVEQATNRGVTRILLEVREGNTVAKRLYISSGFEEVGRRPGMYPNGETAVVMELKILDFMQAQEEAYVTFIATLSSGELREKSRFLKVSGRWLYDDGEFDQAVQATL